MKLHAVFFDMGGTIQTYRYDREMRVKRISFLRDCLNKGGIHLNLTDDQLADVILDGISEYQKWNRQSLIELPPQDVWSTYVFKDYPINKEKLTSIAEELSYIYETRFYENKLRPEIPEVLASIKKMGLKIGIISNVQSRRKVPESLEAYGIIKYFSTIVLSSEYGVRKPDPSIFYHAARLAKLPTGSCVYVGDKLSRDIVGAQHSGFRLAVQIRHDFEDGEKDEGATPDAIITNMLELLPILYDERRKGIQGDARTKGRKIKGLFFDAGNILYCRPHRGQHIKKFLSENKPSPPPNIIRERMKLKDQAFQGILDRQAYYEKLILLYGFKDPEVIAEGVNALIRDATTVEIIEGVPETLQALKKQGFILGIITDTATPIHIKLDWFAQAGFGHIWDSIISSKEIGTRKPAAIIYEEAFLRTGLKVDQAVFIGHKASELKGAHSVGMATIAFNHTKRAVADVYIKKFRDLLDVPLLK